MRLDDVPYLGEMCALTGPLCWSVAVILYRRSSEQADPIGMTLFKNGVATGLLTLTLLIFGIGLPNDRALADWARLAFSGILGLAIADILLFEALRRIGAARLAVVDTIYAPLMVLLSWLFLNEKLSAGFLLGAAVLMSGVLLANVEPRAVTGIKPDRSLWVGSAFGLASIVCTAVGVLFTKPLLADADLIEVTWTRMVAGLLGQAVWMLARGDHRLIVDAFRPKPVWRTLLPATVIGTYLSLILWLGGFKWADVSVAAVLNQTATVYVLVLARFVLHEPVPWHRALGGLLAAIGAVLVVWGGAR